MFHSIKTDSPYVLFSTYAFKMKCYFYIKHFLLNTPLLTAFKTWYNTNWPNASISYKSVVRFHFWYFYFQRENTFRLIHLAVTCVSRMMIQTHRLTRCCPFWFLNPLKYLSVQFPSGLFAGNIPTQDGSHSCILLRISARQVGMICYSIFKSSVLVFCKNSVFWLSYS